MKVVAMKILVGVNIMKQSNQIKLKFDCFL